MGRAAQQKFKPARPVGLIELGPPGPEKKFIGPGWAGLGRAGRAGPLGWAARFVVWFACGYNGTLATLDINLNENNTGKQYGFLIMILSRSSMIYVITMNRYKNDSMNRSN